MCLHGQWEMEHMLVDPNGFDCQIDGYLSKNTDIIFIFPFIATLCLKYYGWVQLNGSFCRQILVSPSTWQALTYFLST